jgi:hypothetical protein
MLCLTSLPVGTTSRFHPGASHQAADGQPRMHRKCIVLGRNTTRGLLTFLKDSKIQ